MARILIVEDDRETRTVLQKLLRLDGHDVVAADTVTAGLRSIADAEPFDVLISDLLLPDGTGWDLIKTAPKTPFAAIALSGSVTENDRKRSFESGFCLHLTKPITFTALLDAVEKCLSEKEGGREK